VPVEILMPSAGPSITEVSLVRWLKQEGDAVKAGEPLFEVETDKAVVEVAAQHAGVLRRILVRDGTTGVKVNDVVGLLVVDGEASAALAASLLEPRGVPSRDAAVALVANAAPIVGAVPEVHTRARVLASPLARRTADKLGVDLTMVSGGGPHGRVLRADVEAVAKSDGGEPNIAPHVSTAGTRTLTEPGADFDDIPHSNMRKIIAQRLVQAKRTVPHFYLTIECCVDALQEMRRQLNQQLDGAKPTVNDFIVKAAARALSHVPECNAAWTDAVVRRYRRVDISVAVATPGGLITPIVRDANEKSLVLISTEMRDLVMRAKEGRLKPDEYQGGGFTISNLGMYGIREFSAIVNPPQACILAVGEFEPRAVVRGGALAVATQMTCTLSVDHRVVDGVLGAKFLAEFRRLVENPLWLVI
jgi:pyruvate dehydrogenase E2 component (dihydrolipoamide acetyltransferase)